MSTNNGVQSKDVSNTFETVANLVNYSNVRQKKVKSKCIQIVGSRIKTAKDCYFNILEYCTVFAIRSRDTYGVSERARLSEMKKVYENVY